MTILEGAGHTLLSDGRTRLAEASAINKWLEQQEGPKGLPRNLRFKDLFVVDAQDLVAEVRQRLEDIGPSWSGRKTVPMLTVLQPVDLFKRLRRNRTRIEYTDASGRQRSAVLNGHIRRPDNHWKSAAPFLAYLCFCIEGGKLVLRSGYAHRIMSLDCWVPVDSDRERASVQQFLECLSDLPAQLAGRFYGKKTPFQIKVVVKDGNSEQLHDVSIDFGVYDRDANDRLIAAIETQGSSEEAYLKQKAEQHALVRAGGIKLLLDGFTTERGGRRARPLEQQLWDTLNSLFPPF